MSFAKIVEGLCIWGCLGLLSFSALACHDEIAWKDFSDVSLNMPKDPEHLVFKKYQNGVYVRLSGKSGTKEMYQLGGVNLYRGVTVSEPPSPSPFFMIDMPLGMIMGVLREAFKTPCDVPIEKTDISYGKVGEKISGWVHRTESSAVVFDWTVAFKEGASVVFSGKVEFSPTSLVPEEAIITDWLAFRGAFLNEENRLELGESIRTIADVEALLGKKQ